MERGTGPAAGQILVATNPGQKAYFDQSVVLILDHGDHGTLGVCLHQVANVEMVDALAHFQPMLTPPARLFEGGPVNSQAAVCLAQVANRDEEPPGWKRVFDDVGMLDLETPVELVTGAYSHMRIYIGLSGWDTGQLEGELIRGAWFRTSARAEEVFGSADGLWRTVLRRMGGPTGRWSTWTDSPELN